MPLFVVFRGFRAEARNPYVFKRGIPPSGRDLSKKPLKTLVFTRVKQMVFRVLAKNHLFSPRVFDVFSMVFSGFSVISGPRARNPRLNQH